ncbi:MAG: hypothetical protein IPK96_12285 [Flammeovirgaceae bacterium]|nr:hypothetical protein [Flammeovirgaceae bacterium]
MRRYLGIILAIGVLLSCSSEDPVNPDFGLNFFPLQTGMSWIYQVDETTITQLQEAKLTYELRVTISDSVRNSSGQDTFIFTRETRTSSASSWQRLDTWSARIENDQLIQSEGNTLFVKLLFPASIGLFWNGNQFNNLLNNGNLFNGSDSESYRITAYDHILELGQQSIRKVLWLFKTILLMLLLGKISAMKSTHPTLVWSIKK